MKICHLTTVHPPFDTRIFHKEGKTLVKTGYDVILIAQHNKDVIVDGVKIVALPKSKNRLQRIIKLPLKTAKFAFKQKADIFHFHDPELIPVGVLLRLFTNGKVIYDVHEDYSKQIISKSYLFKTGRNLIAFFIKIIEFISSKFFDGIVTATDDILRNFSYHKRAISARNFPIISNFSFTNGENKKDIFNIIYVGCLSEIRGITQIIQAVEFINKKMRLTLYGKFYPLDYEKQVKMLRGFKKVEYLGWLVPEKASEVLSKSNAGIVCFLPEPNHLNAMPNKIFEYMAGGIPVIASNFPLWGEIVKGNNCGICVDPLQPRDIAEAIQWIMNHPDEAKQMGKNGRDAVKKKYNWETESKKLLKLYEELRKDNRPMC